MLPKSVCDVMSCEIVRFFKLTPTGQVIPMNFSVPRRHVGDFFQDDIFPPTWDRKPTQSSAEFWGGATAEPNYVSLEPAQ
jgi:Type of WD40 repeat